MEIKRIGSQRSIKRPAERFIGAVRIVPFISQMNAPSRGTVGSVTFEPGVRTAWHIHPLRQTIIVTGGCGRVRSQGSSVAKIRPADAVWICPGERHQHGAAPATAMTHISVLDGSSATWLEHASDAEYHEGQGES